MSLPKQYHDENTRHRRKATDPSHWASVAHIFVTTIDVTVWRTKVILTDGIEYFVAEAFRSTGFSKLLNSFIVGLVMSLVTDRVTLGARQGRWLGVTVFPRFCAWTFVAIQTKNIWKDSEYNKAGHLSMQLHIVFLLDGTLRVWNSWFACFLVMIGKASYYANYSHIFLGNEVPWLTARSERCH